MYISVIITPIGGGFNGNYRNSLGIRCNFRTEWKILLYLMAVKFEQWNDSLRINFQSLETIGDDEILQF